MTADPTTWSASGVAKMLSLSAEPVRSWSPEELRAVLHHQLEASVEFDLAAMDPARARRLEPPAASGALPVKSFHDLLAHPHPPVELLTLTKNFAKRNADHSDTPLPKPVALALYYAAIAAALARRTMRITKLSDAELRQGFSWAMKQPWMDDTLRGVFKEALTHIARGGGETR